MIRVDVRGFDWDDGNRDKCQEHGLSLGEIENFFQQNSLFILPDPKHSQAEERFLAVGRSSKGQPMLAVFTLREKQKSLLIRPMSARYMHEKEARKYDEESTKIQK